MLLTQKVLRNLFNIDITYDIYFLFYGIRLKQKKNYRKTKEIWIKFFKFRFQLTKIVGSTIVIRVKVLFVSQYNSAYFMLVYLTY